MARVLAQRGQRRVVGIRLAGAQQIKRLSRHGLILLQVG
jgi:hypothetical protein